MAELTTPILNCTQAEYDRLYKTAQALLELYDLHGPEQFRMRFASLGVLDVCRQIVAEGEGNPHPWPDA